MKPTEKKSKVGVKSISITTGSQKLASKLGGEIKKPAILLLPTATFFH